VSYSAVPDLLCRAVDRHRAGDIAAAEGLYRAVLAQTPDQPDALHLLGLALLAKGTPEEALNLVRHAVRVAPATADYHVTLGNAQQILGLLSDARDSYAQAIALNSAVEGAHNNLGIVLRELGEPEAAADAFRKACKAAPDDSESWTNLGMALKESGRLEEADAVILRALSLDEKSVAALTQLGALRAKQERVDEAISAYRAALELNPNDPEANDNLGWALLLAVKNAPLQAPAPETLTYLEKAVALAPERWSGWENLGNALLRFNRFDDALVAYNRATALLRRPAGGHNRHLTFRLTSRAKLTHDAEQIRYLIDHNRIGSDGPALLASYESALARLPPPPPGTHVVEMDAAMQDSIGATYNRLWNSVDAPEIRGGAVSRLDRTTR
jgi:Flp pilus assembly protein TadD